MSHSSEEKNKPYDVGAMVMNEKGAMGGERGPRTQPSEVREDFRKRGKTSGRGISRRKVKMVFIYLFTGSLCEALF